MVRRGVTKVLVIAIAALGCGDRRLDSDISIRNHLEKRRILASAYDTILSTTFSPQDTILLDPLSIRADATGIWVHDGAQAAILRFDHSGKRQWSLGRKGGGPAEFVSVRDIELAQDGNLVVLDPGLGRLTVLSPAGEVLKLIDISRAGHAEQVVALSKGRYILGTMRSDRPFVVIDSTGAVLDSLRSPWSKFSTLDPMVSQYYLAGSNSSRLWMAGLILCSVFSVMDSTSPLIPAASYIEWSDPPSATETKLNDGSVVTHVPNAPTAVDVALTDTALYVLHGGRSASAQKVIDVYDPRTGRYRHSFLLPVVAWAFAVEGNAFYLLAARPAPNILVLRPRPAN